MYLLIQLACFTIVVIAQKGKNFVENRRTMVHLFEWKWQDVGEECVRFLGPRGFAGVQVSFSRSFDLYVFHQISPPNENVVAPSRPWTERYQPVSYDLTTRSGTEAEFASMVAACNGVGVRIYVDVVVNHMAALAGRGTGGGKSFADMKTYPAVPFSFEHFHTTCDVDNYLDPENVRNCEYKHRRDLDQSLDYVRNKVAEYLNRLIDLGVAGFRIQSAKYMWPEDLERIYAQLKKLNTDHGFDADSNPFIYQEVNDLEDFYDQIISKKEYRSLGAVEEFSYSQEINRAFKGDYNLSNLSNWGPDWGFVGAGDALVFVDNPEYQRHDWILSHKSPKSYKMAVAFMLAHPYGTPRLISSYFFTNPTTGPPQDTHENIKSPTVNGDGTCGNGFVCEHRWRQIANMVEFRNVVGDAPLGGWWSRPDNGHQIAFCRGNVGFIAFTNEGDFETNLQTCLPAGNYCDVISGSLTDGKCTGRSITIGNDGNAFVHIEANAYDGVLALHINAKTTN